MKKKRKSTVKKSRKLQPKKNQLSKAEKIKADMLRVLLRKRSESLGAACKAAGMSPTIFYYRLKKANFGEGRKGKARKFSLSALDAKKLKGVVRRQERLQTDLQKLERLLWG